MLPALAGRAGPAAARRAGGGLLHGGVGGHGDAVPPDARRHQPQARPCHDCLEQLELSYQASVPALAAHFGVGPDERTRPGTGPAPDAPDVPAGIALADATLRGEWGWLQTLAGAAASPEALDAQAVWLPAPVPGTVATAMRAAGRWDDGAPPPLHQHDHWYRIRFAGHGRRLLRFNGLATLAEVWLNGRLVLTARHMFIAHQAEVDLAGDNTLHLCFRALYPWLRTQRGRARWKPRMITPPSLRAVRTTLLGHMPGWCPPVHAVGLGAASNCSTRPPAVPGPACVPNCAPGWMTAATAASACCCVFRARRRWPATSPCAAAPTAAAVPMVPCTASTRIPWPANCCWRGLGCGGRTRMASPPVPRHGTAAGWRAGLRAGGPAHRGARRRRRPGRFRPARERRTRVLPRGLRVQPRPARPGRHGRGGRALAGWRARPA